MLLPHLTARVAEALQTVTGVMAGSGLGAWFTTTLAPAITNQAPPDPTSTLWWRLIADGGAVGAVVALYIISSKNQREMQQAFMAHQATYVGQLQHIATDCHQRHREAQDAAERHGAAEVQQFRAALDTQLESHRQAVTQILDSQKGRDEQLLRTLDGLREATSQNNVAVQRLIDRVPQPKHQE